MPTPALPSLLLLLPAILGADLSPGYYSASFAVVPCAKGTYKEGIGLATACQTCAPGTTTADVASDSGLLCQREYSLFSSISTHRMPPKSALVAGAVRQGLRLFA
jgi:hypothetical protein